MTPNEMPKPRGEIRYSPRPISAYKIRNKNVEYGPATSAMLRTTSAWNLAYLSHDFERSLLHPDPNFTVNIRHTTQMMLDGSGRDLTSMSGSGTVDELLHLPAPRFVHLITRHPVLVQLPMYLAYGHAWLKTIEKRSFLCQVEEYRPDDIEDFSQAQAELERFL